MFNKGDMVTVANDSGTFTGTFVRYYGDKVQVRTGTGKFTGAVITTNQELQAATNATIRSTSSDKSREAPSMKQLREELPEDAKKELDKVRLGSTQARAIEFLKKQAQASYRQLATELGIPIPRAARVIRSLVESKLVEKSVSEDGNTYKVL